MQSDPQAPTTRRTPSAGAALALGLATAGLVHLGQRAASPQPPLGWAAFLGAFAAGKLPVAGRRSVAAAAVAAAPTAVPISSPAKSPPSLDYPPPAASLTWPRYLSWLAATYAAVQGFRRKLFGGAEAVALDPALPWAVRFELIQSRRELRAKGRSAPRAFQSMLKESADTLEELPALLVTVAVLAGEALRRSRPGGTLPLTNFRRLGEAQALLFTAGRLHQGMPWSGGGTMRLLGGDFLFAEGQWIMAELGSLPAIRRTARMIRDVSDGTSAGGAAEGERGCMAELGAKTALRAAFLRAGTYFAMVSAGAAWLSGAPMAAVLALHRYGADLGCALDLAQYRSDLASQDCALWLARSAQEALRGISKDVEDTAAVRGMRRLAHRVERSCAATLSQLLRRHGAEARTFRGLSYGDFCELHRELEDASLLGEGHEHATAAAPVGPGFQRDEVSERELQRLIAAGLGADPVPRAPEVRWPEGGPKVALAGAMKFIGKDLAEVNQLLEGSCLAKPAGTEVVQQAVVQLFGTSGKRLRPALVLLVARALNAPESGLRRVASLAASVEVLHSASLVHDDILDGAPVRRGEPTAHTRLGERAATLVGDFLFATASCLVAELGSMPVVLLISKVVADFGRGELAQSAVRFEAVDYSLEDYLAKSFYKTASLLAAACQAAAVLSGAGPSSKEANACYAFGAYIGLAFQVVDDVLDFTSTDEELGKPALADLKEGNLSAPVLFAALQGPRNGEPLDPAARRELLQALERRLSNDGDLERVLSLVDKAGGVAQAKALARRFADLAVLELGALTPGEAREGLRIFAEFVVARTS